MFNLKYNFLVGIQIIVGILNTALLMRIFGVSIQSDAYLLASSILVSLQGIQNMFIIQFIHFYNDEKVKSKGSANKFYNCSLLFAFIFGLLSFIIFYLFLNQIIHMFVLNIDTERLLVLKQLLFVSTIVLVFYPIISINEAILNAEMRFSIPYILNTLPNATVVLAQVVLLYLGSKNITILAFAQSIASVMVAVFGTIYVSQKLIPFKFQLWHEIMPKFIKNSFEIASGHAFYGIMFNLVLNNFLVLFSKGIVSCYYYAKKIIDISTLFSLGPSKSILRSNISKALANSEPELIKNYIKKFIKLSVVIFTIVAITAYLLQGPIIKLISNGSINNVQIKQISYLFLGLLPWSLIELLGVPFAQLNIAAKKSIYLITANIGFIIAIIITLYLFKNILQLYSIIPATIIAATTCTICHIIFSKKIFVNLRRVSNE